MGLIRVLEG